MDTEFFDIIGYENLYKINKLGQILSNKTTKILKNVLDNNGYYVVCLGKNKKKSIHRLLAINFISNPNNYNIVDHIDMNKQNNNLENLRWVNNKINSRNNNQVYNCKGHIKINRTTKFGIYYIAYYNITYGKRISKSSYNENELKDWLNECLVKYPRTEKI